MRWIALSLALVADTALAQASSGPTGGLPAPSTNAVVVIAEDPRTISNFSPDPERIDALFNLGLTAFVRQPSREAAWRSLVTTQDVVGIKVVSGPGAASGTRPAVAAAIARGLLAAGVPPAQIIFWDKQWANLRRSGYVDLAARLGVGVAAVSETPYDESVSYDSALLGKLVWGDVEFGKNVEDAGRRSFVSQLLTRRFTRIINVTPLLNHNLAGVSGSLFTLSLDSIDNALRFEFSPEHLAQAVPEVFALEAVGDKVALHVVDALICQYHGEERSLLHYSTMLGQIRFATDPVALDMLSIQEIDKLRRAQGATAPRPNLKIYSNAALLELGIQDLQRVTVVKVP